MRDEVKTLRDNAEKARLKYHSKLITREQAKEEIMPYINACNTFAKQLAKKYGVRPRLINFNSFIR